MWLLPNVFVVSYNILCLHLSKAGDWPHSGLVWQTVQIAMITRLLARLRFFYSWNQSHNSDVIMKVMPSQITGVSFVYSTVCSGADQREHQSSASLTFVRGIYQWPADPPHKGPVTREKFPLDYVIMNLVYSTIYITVNRDSEFR